MTNQTTPSMDSYLNELDQALRDLPRGRRQEIVRDIRTHIDAALADAPGQTPTEIATILDQLGTPAEIAEAARAELPPVRSRIAGRDVVAIVLLLIGGIAVPFLGWIVGVVLLWTSTAWRTKDKLIGTLLVPGGLLAPVLLALLAFRAATISCETVTVSPPSPANPSGGDVVQTCTSAAGSGVASTILTIVLVIITVGGPLFSTFWLVRHARRVA